MRRLRVLDLVFWAALGFVPLSVSVATVLRDNPRVADEAGSRITGMAVIFTTVAGTVLAGRAMRAWWRTRVATAPAVRFSVDVWDRELDGPR